MSQWVKCSERKPTKESAYIVDIVPMANGRHFIRMAWFDPEGLSYNGWSNLHTALLEYITHWMPLPETPNKGVE